VAKIRDERLGFLEKATNTIAGLSQFGFQPHLVNHGEAEIGFEIPRSIFEDAFGGFIDELTATKFIVETAALIETGKPSGATVSQLSTSDPLVILGMDPRIIAMVGAFVTWALHTWKQVEEIRAIRKKSQEAGLDDIAKQLDAKIEETISTEIAKKTSELLESVKKRDKELENRTNRALRMLLERIERGFTVHIRLPPRRDDDVDSDGDAVLSGQLNDLRDDLTFPKPSGKPILQLTKSEPEER
jgi:hypothetical protein